MSIVASIVKLLLQVLLQSAALRAHNMPAHHPWCVIRGFAVTDSTSVVILARYLPGSRLSAHTLTFLFPTSIASLTKSSVLPLTATVLVGFLSGLAGGPLHCHHELGLCLPDTLPRSTSRGHGTIVTVLCSTQSMRGGHSFPRATEHVHV